MIDAATVVAGAMLVALILYALTGGADYGAGTWDLLASGPSRRKQRAIIEAAIAPIWEANHVWLIVVVTVLFTGFPRAFAVVTTALHVPVLLLLLGVVLRGTAFTFRAHDPRGGGARKRWSLIFSVSSLFAPILLGAIVGALSSGKVRMDGWEVVGGYYAPWIAVWPLMVGLFTLALFSYLAATYLCVEAESRERGAPAVRAFRSRALVSWCAVTLLAWFLLFLSRSEAPVVFADLVARRAAWPLHLATGLASLGALAALLADRFRWARLCAAAQVALIVAGWGIAQYPCLVAPDVTIANAAAPLRTLHLLEGALIAGSILLFPSLLFLYRAFKGEFPLSPFEPKR